MAKAHQASLLGEWARENGFESIARNHHPQEVERRRQQGVKRYNENLRRKEEERYSKEKRR